MAYDADDVITEARKILLDTTGTRWPDADHYQWITDGQAEMGYMKPDTMATRSIETLVAGTRQTIPTAAQRLLRILWVSDSNTDDETAPKQAVTRVQPHILDAAFPNWHDDGNTEAPHTTYDGICNYVYDELQPSFYYVFPGISTGSTVYANVEYVKQPTVVTAGADLLEVNDMYFTALVGYCVFRAFSTETEINSTQKAASYYQSFQGILTGKTQLDGITHPGFTQPNVSKRAG